MNDIKSELKYEDMQKELKKLRLQSSLHKNLSKEMESLQLI